MNDHITKAIEILKNGGIVLFPTDTAFGIGCRIDNEEAVEKLFSVRQRPITQATPVLVDTVKMAERFTYPIPEDVINSLIEPYWPGALTIILPCKTEKVPSLVRGEGVSLGVRIPNHPIARQLIREVGVPILGPSANFHGQQTPYTIADIDPKLIHLTDYLVPGECRVKKESTVIDCSVSPWKIVRQGAVKINT
jgi:L-threonylcarbamoyladenylate synthase